jgi:hypothetical protein
MKLNKIWPALLLLPLCLLWAPCARAQGTHFLVEPSTGLTFNHGFELEDGVGLEAGGTLAVGGKFKGFPPRFYAYFRVRQAMFGSQDIYLPARDAHCQVSRAYTDVVGGLRVVVPLFWRVRLQAELGGGATFSQNEYRETGLRPISYAETLHVLEFGGGLNVRVFRWLSAGLMVHHSLVVEDEYGDAIASRMGDRDRGASLAWTHLNLQLGFHF